MYSRKIFFIIQHIKKALIYLANKLESLVYKGDFNLKKPYKNLNFYKIFKLLLRVLFFRVKVTIPKKTISKFTNYLQESQLIIVPTHTFVIEVLVLYELFAKVKKPFYLMIAREFFDMVLGLANFPLRCAGCFSVARGSKEAKQSIQFANYIIKETDIPLVLFPEGESSLNIKSLLPVKKGVGILAKTAQGLDKEISILPIGFKIRYSPEIIGDLNWIIDELEWYLNLPRSSSDNYRLRIIMLIEEIIDRELLNLGVKSHESLLRKAQILYKEIHKYLSNKYSFYHSEERAYEIHLKSLKQTNEIRKDLALIYKWIEVKGLTQFLPKTKETSPTIWAGLIGKLLRVIYGDYGYESISRILKHVQIEPVLGEPVPVKSLTDKSVEEITDIIQDKLINLNNHIND